MSPIADSHGCVARCRHPITKRGFPSSVPPGGWISILSYFKNVDFSGDMSKRCRLSGKNLTNLVANSGAAKTLTLAVPRVSIARTPNQARHPLAWVCFCPQIPQMSADGMKGMGSSDALSLWSCFRVGVYLCNLRTNPNALNIDEFVDPLTGCLAAGRSQLPIRIQHSDSVR